MSRGGGPVPGAGRSRSLPTRGDRATGARGAGGRRSRIRWIGGKAVFRNRPSFWTFVNGGFLSNLTKEAKAARVAANPLRRRLDRRDLVELLELAASDRLDNRPKPTHPDLQARSDRWAPSHGGQEGATPRNPRAERGETTSGAVGGATSVRAERGSRSSGTPAARSRPAGPSSLYPASYATCWVRSAENGRLSRSLFSGYYRLAAEIDTYTPTLAGFSRGTIKGGRKTWV